MFRTGDPFLCPYPTPYLLPCNAQHGSCGACYESQMKNYSADYGNLNDIYYDYAQQPPLDKTWILPSQAYPSPVSDIIMADDNTTSPVDQVSPINPEPAPPASAQTMADLQKLSQEYQPEVTGDLVGQLQSSKAIEEQYINADPAFVRKTRALTPKYSHYRHVRGDGNCGWRAIAFGYLELVQRSGDDNLVAKERDRIVDLKKVMKEAGHEEYLFEDFVQETIDAFAVISSSLASGNKPDEKPLLEVFNDQGRSDAIVTHMKLLTSSWMRKSPEQYAPFLDTSVEKYCATNVEPYGAEIDHIGMNALIECLILPAGFAAEIFYLDRSEGEEVNVHRFGTSEGKDDIPTIRLLYRPGHYDMIYKNGDLEKPPASLSDPSSFNVPPLTVGIARILETDENRAYREIYSETGSRFKALRISQHPEVPEALPQLSWSDTLPRSVFKKASVAEDMPANFRPSLFQFRGMEDINFQKLSSQNSHINTSHFQNENFQPEMYSPQD